MKTKVTAIQMGNHKAQVSVAENGHAVLSLKEENGQEMSVAVTLDFPTYSDDARDLGNDAFDALDKAKG